MLMLFQVPTRHASSATAVGVAVAPLCTDEPQEQTAIAIAAAAGAMGNRRRLNSHPPVGVVTTG
jgi:hypothetical protein